MAAKWRMSLMIVVALAMSGACANAVAEQSYLARTVALLERYKADLAAMKPVAEEAAARLASGGKLWAAGLPELVAEMTSRAGGLMMIRRLDDAKPGPDDVVLYFPFEDASKQLVGGDPKALVARFGTASKAAGERAVPTHAKESGVSEGIAMAAAGWVFMGELVGALTRIGKMPVIYETIGAYYGYARIETFKNGEVPFHEATVAEVAPGVIGGRYIDRVSGALKRIEKEERADLDRAGAWAREAKANGKRLFMYGGGHMLPDEISSTEIGKLFRPDTWNTTGGAEPAVPGGTFASGDLMVHIGYQHPAHSLLKAARDAGARAVYVSVRGDRDFARDAGTIWIDPMWEWSDGCVEFEGYDVPLLPASGLVNSAVAWEIYRLSRMRQQ